MIVNANLSLYFPENKWLALTYPRAFVSSSLFHGGLFVILICLAAQMQAQAPVCHSDRAVFIELVPDLAAAAPAAGFPVPLAVVPDPDATPQRLLNHQMPAPTTRRAPVLNKIATNIENSIPANANAVSMAVLNPKSPLKSFNAIHRAGIGSPFVGAPARPAPTGLASARLIQVGVGSPSVPMVDIKPINLVSNAVAAFGNVPTTLDPVKNWLDLDAEACRLHGQATSLVAADPAAAKVMFERSADLMQQVLFLLRQSLSKDQDPLIAEALRNTGRCYDSLHQYEKAESYYQKSIKMYNDLDGPNSKGAAISMAYLGDLFMVEAKYQQALDQFQMSLPAYEKSFGARSKEVGWTYQRLGTAYRGLGNIEKARQSFALSSGP